VPVRDGYVSEEEAELERRRKEASFLPGVQIEGTSTPWTVDVVCAEYLADVAIRTSSAYHRSETSRLANLGVHLGPMLAERVTSKRLQHYAAARAREATRLHDRDGGPGEMQLTRRSSIREEIAAWRRAVKCVRDLGRIDFGPPDMPDLSALPEDSRPARRLTEADVAALIAAASYEEEPRTCTPGAAGLPELVTALAWTGRRPVAIFAIRRKHCVRLLDPKLPRRARLLWWDADKGGRERGWGPLTEPAYEAIVRRLETMEDQDPDALLWRTPTGLAYDSVRISRTFARVVARAGLAEVEPYDLRRYACTRILAAVGNRLKVAIRYTGHRRVETLLRYVYDDVHEAEEAASRIGWTPQLEEVRRRG
jgi:integrase